MSHWFIYLLLMLDNFQCFLSITAIIAALGVVAGLFHLVFCEEFDDKKGAVCRGKRLIKVFSVIFFFFMVSSHAVPSTKQAAAIWLVPKAANNEQLQEIPAKGLEILQKKMDLYLDELTEEGQ